ncbi:phosphotransferase [Tateyamaria sp. ANG-S1]|uniref:phosphotransferase n=1 Tax=Tateyamaria sp. ANG-S1 TaxID=1577905 RepID=UPI00068DC1D2|nr:phosphotransferase [Tateyamaria sp. ANG-S1]
MTPPLGAWGLMGTPAPLPGGHRNTVLRVGDHVLKTTRRSEAGIAWLLPVIDALERSGLSATRPMRSAGGTLIVDGWTCEPFCRGTPCDPSCLQDVWPQLALGTRTIKQRQGFASSKALLYLPHGGDINLSHLPPPLARALRAAWRALDHEGPCVVHGDLNASNLIQTGDRITIIDWDEARMDHPGFDRVALGLGTPAERHAAAAWEIACSWQIEPDHARALVKPFLAHHRRAGKTVRPPC